jgi:RNA polymerase sigma factor (sigma-70 family)
MVSQVVTLRDETALLHRAVAGDEQAFATLLEDCRGRAWAVCTRICGNRDDAEDALQDAAVAAWRNLDRFRGGARFSTWFYRIAANASLQIVRRRRDLPSDQLPEPHGTASFADRVDTADVVQQALAQLRPEFRAALVLREYGALSYNEIAEWQGIPVQTVKSRLNRARTALAALLQGALVEDAGRGGHVGATSCRDR